MTVVYRRLLTDRSFVIGVGAVALSAVALGMIPLSLILSPGESVATGAVAAGAFGLANAVGVPVQGAVMARVPARWIVSIGAGVSCSFMLLVAAMPGSGAQSVLLAGAGVSFPALAAALRASIPRSFSEPAERSGAYALLSVAFQAGLATGPVVAGMLVTSAPRPLSFVVVALVIAAAGGLAAVSMGMTAPTRTARSSLPLAGAAPFARIVSIGGLVAVATGSLTVIVPASVDAAGRDGLAGPVLACLALGEAVGALLFGARPVPSSRRAQLLTALALTAGGFATLVIAADHIVLLAALVLVVGGLSSPVAIVLFGALDVVVPPRFVASAYGVVVVAAVGGSAVGTSVAGLIVGSGGGVAGAAAMAALAISIAGVLSLRHVEGRTPSR